MVLLTRMKEKCADRRLWASFSSWTAYEREKRESAAKTQSRARLPLLLIPSLLVQFLVLCHVFSPALGRFSFNCLFNVELFQE